VCTAEPDLSARLAGETGSCCPGFCGLHLFCAPLSTVIGKSSSGMIGHDLHKASGGSLPPGIENSHRRAGEHEHQGNGDAGAKGKLVLWFGYEVFP
jgi:hypothetical protein